VSDYVFALADTVIRLNHGATKVTLNVGAVFHKADPVVAVHPELFSETPPDSVVRTTPDWKRPAPPAPVEQATAAPGERRTGRR
jgi:hypothetical protein